MRRAKARKEADTTVSQSKRRKKDLPDLDYEELDASESKEELESGDKTEYVTFEVTGSKGQTYRITVPYAYYRRVPKEWQWDEQKYIVAELIAAGIPISQIPNYPEVHVKSRMTIYGWLQHPEFKEHVDGLILETGFASKRERIAGMSRVTRMLFDKLVNELEQLKLTDKSVGSIISGFRDLAKQLAQEKEEFVEQARVEQDTKLSGTVATASVPIEQYLASLKDDEREAMEKEFSRVADQYIQQLRGDITDIQKGEQPNG